MSEKSNGSCEWGLSREKDYLDGLGTGRWSRNTQQSRHTLLKSYINTIHYRREPWAAKAKKYAEKLLQEEQPLSP